jgi:hypothetical protein
VSNALYQGTTLVVPSRVNDHQGFSPCCGRTWAESRFRAMFTSVFGSEEEPQGLKPDGFTRLWHD